MWDRGTAGPVPHGTGGNTSRKSEQIDIYSLLRGHIGETAPPPEAPKSDPDRGTGPAVPRREPTHDAALAALVLTLHLGNPRWMRDAACKTTTGLDWHTDTERRGRETREAVAVMKAVCADCPVLDDCTTWTLDDRSTDRLPGVVAGLDVTERRSRRRTAAALRRSTATATKGRTNAPS